VEPEGYVDGECVFVGVLVEFDECYWELCYLVCESGKFSQPSMESVTNFRLEICYHANDNHSPISPATPASR